MISLKSKGFLAIVFSGILATTILIAIINYNGVSEDIQQDKISMSMVKSPDTDVKYTGKSLVKNSDFIGKIKITKLKEKDKKKIYELPLEPDSIGAQQGHKTFQYITKFNVYESEVLDGIKNPKNLKTIDISNTAIIDEIIQGDHTQYQLEVGNEYFVYLNSINLPDSGDRYSLVTLSNGIFKVQKEGKSMKNATRTEDIETHKNFVNDNKD